MKGNFAKMAVADLSDLNSKRYVNTPAALLLDTVPLRAPRRCPPRLTPALAFLAQRLSVGEIPNISCLSDIFVNTKM